MPNLAPPGIQRADLPIFPARARLDDLELRIEREGHPRILQRHVSIGPRIVDLGDDLVDAARGESGVRLAHVLTALRDPVGIGWYGVVLVEAAHDQHGVVGQRDGRGIPAGVLLVRRFGRLGALLVSRIAVLVELGVGVAREELPPERVLAPIGASARLRPLDPGFGLRIEDVDLVQAVVALHVVAAEDVDASVGQGRARIAVHVVEHALRIAILRERRAVHGEVGLVEQARVELARGLERVGMTDVEEQLPFHGAVRLDARRDALAQPLPHQVAAIREPLEGIVGRSVRAEAQERIEAMEDVPEGRVELHAGSRECTASNGEVDDLRIGHVVGDVFREPGVEQYLGRGRLLLPHQTHMHGFRALHRNERRDLTAARRVSDGSTVGLSALGPGGTRSHQAEAENGDETD